MHVFLSPHLDDAVLSCGAFIYQLVQQGQQVLVMTVMAGDPPAHPPDTPLTRDLHQRWAAGDSPIEARRTEDREALSVLGAMWQHLPVPDCPYRMDGDGNPLYTTNDSLFGAIHPDDPARTIALNLPDNATVIYGPLGAGGHVDHKVVRELSQPIADFFYAEYPYSATSDEALRITYKSGVQLHGEAAVQVALEAFQRPLAVTEHALDAAALAAKVEAIACYRSQISTFWDDITEMEQRVRAYGAERLWS